MTARKGKGQTIIEFNGGAEQLRDAVAKRLGADAETGEIAAPDSPAAPFKSYRFAGSAELRHIAVRKQGPDDEKEVYATIKLRLNTNADGIAFLSATLRDFLWDQAGIVRSMFLEELFYKVTVSGMILEFVNQERNMKGDVKNFKIFPKDGFLCDLEVSFDGPANPLDLAMMTEFLGETVEILIADQNLFLGEDMGSCGDAKPDAENPDGGPDSEV